MSYQSSQPLTIIPTRPNWTYRFNGVTNDEVTVEIFLCNGQGGKCLGQQLPSRVMKCSVQVLLTGGYLGNYKVACAVISPNAHSTHVDQIQPLLKATRAEDPHLFHGRHCSMNAQCCQAVRCPNVFINSTSSSPPHHHFNPLCQPQQFPSTC